MPVKVPASLMRLFASQELDQAQSHLFDSLCSSRGQPSAGAGLCSVPKHGLTLFSLLLYTGKLQRAFKFTSQPPSASEGTAGVMWEMGRAQV